LTPSLIERRKDHHDMSTVIHTEQAVGAWGLRRRNVDR